MDETAVKSPPAHTDDFNSALAPAPAPAAHKKTATRARDLAVILAALPIIALLTANTWLFSQLYVLNANRYWVIAHAYFVDTVLFPGALALAAAAAGALWAWRRRRPLALAALALAGLALAVVAVRLYASEIEPYRLQVRRVTIASPKIHAPLRLVHFTDLQTPAVRDYERHIFEVINSLQPDLVIHTGDMLQPVAPATVESEEPRVEALFRSLRAPLGVFNVGGDADVPMIVPFMRGFGGLKTLFNAEATVAAKGGTRLRLLGLDLGASTGGPEAQGLVKDWLATVKPDEFTILFGHRPDYVLTVMNEPIDLCLAGHTHGGQIRIPFFGPIMTESNVPRAWARGYREVGRTRLNVSAAVGAEHACGMPAIRINCPPELTVIDLVPAGKQESLSIKK